MDLFIVCILFLFVVVALFYWLKITYTKKYKNLDNELKFFKKEKEYYTEAMMVYNSSNKIAFANQSAKDLFSLVKENNNYTFNIVAGLKSKNNSTLDFFEFINLKANTAGESFHIKEIELIINDKSRLVNMYIDRSSWNINKTTTCIIDTNITNNINKILDNGKIDFLTGMPSQFTALSDINSLVIDSQNNSEQFVLFMIGIDHFSSIQTTLGQVHINNILKNISKYFAENENENLKSYKMDCDKFLVVVRDIDNNDKARKIAIKLISDIANYNKEDISTHLTVSSGVARYPIHGKNATKLINHVYLALNEAQKDAVSSIRIFTAEDLVIYKDDLKMNEEIINGIKNKEFILYYQPVFHLEDNKMVGAEALIRWNHPKLGLIAPDKFLKVAEKTGLIVDIGEYVFREAISHRKQWDELAFSKFEITLNLSLREMQVDKLIQKIAILFKEFNVDPMEFNLDITEHDAMKNIEKTAVDFALFKELGLSISLDNFGADYSSLKYLQMLPLSTLKIDRSLIYDLSSNQNHQEAIKGIISMAHSFGYEVIAEGVETSKEAQVLKGLSCDHAQGYIFARPLPVDEFEELLRD